MAILSKLVKLNKEWCYPYNCYETIHTWEHNCRRQLVEFTWLTFLKSTKMYAPLYIASFLLFNKKKRDPQQYLELVKSIVRSSLFIANHVFVFFTLFCGTTHLMGDKIYVSLSTYPFAAIAGMLSYPIEKKSRRGALANYMTNVAMESLVRMLNDLGLVPSVPHYETLLFSIAMAGTMYLIKSAGFKRDPVSYVVQYLIGPYEARSRAAATKATNNNVDGIDMQRVDSRNGHHTVTHTTCSHPSSCLHYSFSGFAKPFLSGLVGHSLFAVLKYYPKLIEHPSFANIASTLLNKNTVMSALSIGLFSATYKAFNCALRKLNNRDNDWHAAVAGAASSLAMLLSPNSSLSMYFFWKFVDLALIHLYKTKRLPISPQTIGYVSYVSSLGVIGFVMIFVPRYMRRSYVAMLNNVSQNRVSLFNRGLIENQLPDFMKSHTDFVPDLDTKYCSNHYLESVFNWQLEQVTTEIEKAA